MFRMWLRMDEEGRQRVWRLYGWFTGLMLCGSCVGVATWAARLESIVNFLRANDLITQRDAARYPEAYSLFALSRRSNAAFLVTNAIEFLFLSAAQFMVLDRISDFMMSQGDDTRTWWVAGGRAVMAAVVLCNAVGLAASIASAVYGLKAADAYSAASMLYASNNTRNDALEYLSSQRSYTQQAVYIASIRQVCEVVVLLLIVLVFAVVGVACIRRLSSALTILDTAGPDMAAQQGMRFRVVKQAMALGMQLRQEVFVTSSFVFIAFLLRSVVSTMLAVANQSQDAGRSCPNNPSRAKGLNSLCDASCYNQYTHIAQWNSYTTEFLTTVVLISSPLTLLVALWGMTSKLTLQLMRSRQRQLAPTGASPLGLNPLGHREVTDDVSRVWLP
jgi:hypothetical protein